MKKLDAATKAFIISVIVFILGAVVMALSSGQGPALGNCCF